MSDNQYKLFLDGVFRLSKSISIKSEYSAQRVNTDVELLRRYQVDQSSPQTWKEYLNKAGLYHPTDTPMSVISLDTNEVIDFTRANMALHPATRAGHKIGQRYYKELLERYPDQEILIKGIVYPGDLNHIIQAPDFSIVSWDTSLVEEQEEDLIKNLENWVQSFARRWFIKGFTFSHSLYGSSFFGILFQQLPLVILQLRARACRTRQVHSFHVESYLASHRYLDEFLPELTRKQALWLYRNIVYLQANSGQTQNFEDLTENILTARSIPLMSYEVQHDATSLSHENLVPEVKFEQYSENKLKAPIEGLLEKEAILAKIAPLADGNIRYDAIHPEAIPDLGFERKDNYLTKILETESIEDREAALVSTVDVALSLWAYASSTRRFNVFIRINHPVTGEEISMSAADAYYVFHYMYSLSIETPITEVPPFIAMEAPVWPVPSVESLKSIASSQHVLEQWIELMHSTTPIPSNFINIDQFRLGIERQEHAQLQHKVIVDASNTSLLDRLSMKSVYAALWRDQLIKLPEQGSNLEHYLESKSISIGTVSKEVAREIYSNIFTEITGLEIESVQLQNAVQKSMVAIMKRLSSYSVLFVDPQDAIASTGFDWDYVFLDDSPTSSANVYDILSAVIDVEFIKEETTNIFEIPLGDTEVRVDFVYDENVVEIPTDVHLEEVEQVNEEQIVILPAQPTLVTYSDDGVLEPGFIAGLKETLEIEDFSTVPNIYNFECYPRPAVPGPLDPGDLIVSSYLPIRLESISEPKALRDFKPLLIPTKLVYFDNKPVDIILDGFWPSWGEDDLDGFKFHTGENLLNPFKLTPTVDFDLQGWTANIGDQVIAGIGPYTEEGDIIDLGSFKAAYGWMELPVATIIPSAAVVLDLIGFSSSTELGFTSFNFVAEFGLEQVTGMFVMDRFYGLSSPVIMSLNSLGFSAQLPSFITAASFEASIGFVKAIGAVQLLPFDPAQPTIILSSIKSLIPVELDAFYKSIDPIDIDTPGSSSSL